jgi:hypothetical protein
MAVEILVPLGFFTLVGFIVWVISSNARHRKTSTAAAEFNTKLLDRIASAKDFSDFLQTDSGARLMNSLTSAPQAPVRTGAERVLRAAEIGMVLATLGAGLMAVARYLRSDDTMFIGAVALSLGIGFLLAALASFVLGKQLGVIRSRDSVES